MSKHYFTTTHQGRPITLGFDRPLQGFFCTVERDDAGDHENAYLHCNLADLALAKVTGMADSVDHFDALLMARRFNVSRAMLAENDEAGRVGTTWGGVKSWGCCATVRGCSYPSLDIITDGR